MQTDTTTTPMTTAQDILDAMDGVVLVTDHDLTVTAYGRTGWRKSWVAQSPGVPVQDPLGRIVTDAFTPGVIRDTFHLLFRKVLDGEHGIVRLDYRCDSQQMHRMMRLTLTPVGAGSGRRMLYQSVLISEAPRPPVPLIDRARLVDDPDPSATRMCPICTRIWVPGLARDHLDWTEPPVGRADRAVPEVVHEFCPACHGRFFDGG